MFSKLTNNFFRRLDVKLTTYYTLLVFLIAVILGVFFLYRLQHNLMKQVDNLLHDEARELIHMFEREPDVIQVSKINEGSIDSRRYYPFYFRVISTSGNVLYVSQRASTTSFPPPKNRTECFYTLNIPGAKYPFRLYEKIFSLNNSSDFIIQIATETKHIESIMGNVNNNILMAALILLFLSITGGILVARKPCLILRNITAVTNRITSQNLSERLPLPFANDEVKALTMTINSMMDRLEKSFKEIKQFTSDVSHELRNPLFALKGEMELALSQKRKDEEYREEICDCLDRINFLIKMVNDLFLISRFDMKKIDLDLVYLNLCEVLRDLFDFHLPMAQEKNLSFTIDRCDNVVINGDKTRIHQLFSNLIDNAIHFTPANGSVTFSLVGKNDAAQFIVEDTGIGIPEHEIPYVFNRFHQVDKARTGFSLGSGLGLNISKKIAEAHGGDITVRQNENKGVTFVVTLPKVM